MENKILSVAVVGCGSRGMEAYGRLMYAKKDKYKIVSLCDINPKKLEKYSKIFDIPEEQCFYDEAVFFEKRRAELLVIATPDREHVRQCLKALELGYDILLEKPVTDKADECAMLLEAQKKYGGKVFVCHVLRYGPAFYKVNELIEQGVIGRLINIQALEQVRYWHQAHSYVRGQWRRAEDSTPMILAKCCHDLDLLQWYAHSRCESVSSVGSLSFFKEENAPDGSADRCTDCKLVDSCPYSAKAIYVDRWKEIGCLANCWPFNVIISEVPHTEEALMNAIKTGPYGKCVFKCDNNVVDNQTVQMQFENGVTATLTMMAFTAEGGRIMKFYGTMGEIVLDDEKKLLEIKPFGKEMYTIDVNSLISEDGGHSHGGGDYVMIEQLYGEVCGSGENRTVLAASVESHLMGICAEVSRNMGGKTIMLKDIR